MINEQYKLVPDALHAALLALSPTQADAAQHIITTGGVTLTQAQVERAIELLIEDLKEEMVLAPADGYAALLARHQTVDPDVALRVLRAAGNIAILTREKELNQAAIDQATNEWLSLTPAQRAAIPGIKAVADEGIDALTGRNTILDLLIQEIRNKRLI